MGRGALRQGGSLGSLTLWGADIAGRTVTPRPLHHATSSSWVTLLPLLVCTPSSTSKGSHFIIGQMKWGFEASLI